MTNTYADIQSAPFLCDVSERKVPPWSLHESTEKSTRYGEWLRIVLALSPLGLHHLFTLLQDAPTHDGFFVPEGNGMGDIQSTAHKRGYLVMLRNYCEHRAAGRLDLGQSLF